MVEVWDYTKSRSCVGHRGEWIVVGSARGDAGVMVVGRKGCLYVQWRVGVGGFCGS